MFKWEHLLKSYVQTKLSQIRDKLITSTFGFRKNKKLLSLLLLGFPFQLLQKLKKTNEVL